MTPRRGGKCVAKFGQGAMSSRVQYFRNLGALMRRNVLGRRFDGGRDIACRAYEAALRIGIRFQSRAAARIRFAGQQRL